MDFEIKFMEQFQKESKKNPKLLSRVNSTKKRKKKKGTHEFSKENPGRIPEGILKETSEGIPGS